MFAVFDWPYTRSPTKLRSLCRSSKFSAPQRCASEATFTMRAPGRISGSSRPVSRNGARWLTAKIIS